MNKHVFIVSYSFHPETVPAAHRPYFVSKAFVKCEINVRIITRFGCFNSVDAAENQRPELAKFKRRSEVSRVLFSNATKNLAWFMDIDKAVFWGIQKFFPLLFEVLYRTISTRRRQIIWATAPLSTNIYLAFMVSVLSGARLHVDIRDAFRGLTSGRKSFMTYLSLSRAESITTVTPSLSKSISANLQRSVPVVFNGIPENELADNLPLIKQCGWITCIYAGSLYGGARPIELALAILSKAASGLAESWKGIELKLICRDVIDGSYAEFENEKLKIAYCSEKPKRTVQAECMSSHFNLILLGNTYEHSCGIPLKVYDLLLAGRPILIVGPSESDAVNFISSVGSVDMFHIDPWSQNNKSEALKKWLSRTSMASTNQIIEPSAASEAMKIVSAVTAHNDI